MSVAGSNWLTISLFDSCKAFYTLSNLVLGDEFGKFTVCILMDEPASTPYDRQLLREVGHLAQPWED